MLGQRHRYYGTSRSKEDSAKTTSFSLVFDQERGSTKGRRTFLVEFRDGHHSVHGTWGARGHQGLQPQHLITEYGMKQSEFRCHGRMQRVESQLAGGEKSTLAGSGEY